ncbi:hypothetical protein DCS_00774 [Drechmeria coniospora]|uniref:CNH domain-containing protein n=1 Tax=Drechmeria coniospora TaxID=98403 RepID=A0A151GRG6_DRECN|nr:hypothetical protein DCS_00774 [Drechmeria coniospora]KYK59641.1 hypothetical protein DCS_00774 [Drechmeria coniospora]
MIFDDSGDVGSSATRNASKDDGPYLLRPLLENVPLCADGSQRHVSINCVEYLDGNLYVGTSAAELLHFVKMPPDPVDKSGRPLFMLASRLSPTFAEPPRAAAPIPRPGVQQILLLPTVGKACILCNSTAAFYSLPELSPVSGIGQVKNCNWVGGVDLNEIEPENSAVTILLSLKRRIQVVRVGEGVQAYRNIDYAGSTVSIRRDTIACVADSRSYALLDVERRLKIPLMSISSFDEPLDTVEVEQAQAPASEVVGGISRSVSSTERRPISATRAHNRSTSLGGNVLGSSDRHQEAHESDRRDPESQLTSLLPPFADLQSQQADSGAPPQTDTPAPAAPGETVVSSQTLQQQTVPEATGLHPLIVSPTPEEFLLVIGTSPEEPGIGMFVSLDGDTTRSTIEFERYPEQIVVDGRESDLSSSRFGSGDVSSYVLASMAKQSPNGLRYGLEIQRWDSSEATPEKHWLVANNSENSVPYGLRSLVGSDELQFEEVVARLSHKRFLPFTNPLDTADSYLEKSDSRTALSMERLYQEKELFERDDDSQDDNSPPDGWEAARSSEGEEFTRRLASSKVKLAVWSGDRIWWAARTPLIMQLDAALDAACMNGCADSRGIDRRAIFTVLGSIRGREAKTELEFLTLGFIRQRAGLLLVISLLASPEGEQLSAGEMNALEEVLMDSKLEPRVVLSLIPGLRNEIKEGRQGIWICDGVRMVAETYLQSTSFSGVVKHGIKDVSPRVLHFLRRFLFAWKKLKGFGSVPDEGDVFPTVDAALLVVLLELDQHESHPDGGTVRSELYGLVDKGVDCFERAVGLLESYHRLFVLSRLYQSRKRASDVLSTWKRIIEGERDDGNELQDGEKRVRDYLQKVSSQMVVQEYGIWLASRNPRLGAEVFAGDSLRAPSFEPNRVVEMLRQGAPSAVKYYLEHLVFVKGHAAYVNELVTYYLDIVLDDLESRETSREAVVAAYDAYRALRAPKPTYHHFLAENSPDNDEVWQSRLRLLQLLGGAHDYDSAAISARITSLPGHLLVPETIILAGREGRHDDALRLLVHKLGDYDTAVAYCLRGGRSVYVPPEDRRGGGSNESEQEASRGLFRVVLREFLAINDLSNRVEQTGALLERFGGWFDVDEVLQLIPDDWSVGVVASFLASALQRLVRDKHESIMTRALSGAENLRINYDWVVGLEEKGPRLEATRQQQPGHYADGHAGDAMMP